MVKSIPPTGSPLTPRTTPYHVMELVLALLRITFKEADDPNFHFRYTDDFNTTKLLIDTAYNKDSKVIGLKPQLIVSHGDAQSQPAVIGDRAAAMLSGCQKTQTTMVTSSIMARAVSKNYMEADLLGNDVFNFFVACRTLLPQLTSISTVNGLSMSQVHPFTQDDSQYQCIVSIVFQMQYRWTTMLTPKVLEGYSLFINSAKVAEIDPAAEEEPAGPEA